MKRDLTILIIIVASVLSFLLGYSLAPTGPGNQAAAKAGPAAPGYGEEKAPAKAAGPGYGESNAAPVAAPRYGGTKAPRKVAAPGYNE